MALYQDSIDQDFTLDCLPFDCIVCICEFLPVNDLGRFSRVCKLFYEASLVGYLWRRHSLFRWTFCDVQQISAGPQQWRRYFLARRRVEASMEKGRPGKDYKVKTLRGHEKDIVSAHVLGGGAMNWEKPRPPLVISLSQDGCLKAWDVSQGKQVWELEEQGTIAVAADSTMGQLAVGAIDGSVTLWDCERWAKKLTFTTRGGGTVLALKFGSLKPSKRLLMVQVQGDGAGREDQLEVWRLVPQPDPSSPPTEAGLPDSSLPSPELLFQLWAPAHNCNDLELSSSGLLAVPGRAGDVHVWDMNESLPASAPTPLPPLVTVETQYPVGNIHWASLGVLATRDAFKIAYWDIRAKMNSRNQRAPRNTIKMYNSNKDISCDSHMTAIAMVNELVVTGDMVGQVSVYDGSMKTQTGSPLQRFKDHKGAITDIFADSFRVLTCSKDFSIRVYCWKKDGDKVTLESKYTLLGGSVALKTHDGFSKLLCESSCCLGIAGNQLKCYTFTSPPLDDPKVLNIV